MYTLLYILLVNICVISAKSDSDIVDIALDNQSSRGNFTIDEYQKLRIALRNIDSKLYNSGDNGDNCSARCSVGQENFTLTCHQNDQKNELEALTTTNLTTKFDGAWVCNFGMTILVVDGNETKPDSLVTGSRFHLNVTPHPTPEIAGLRWIYLALIGVLVILVIIGQTMCIIHFKKKAIAAQRHVRMSHDATKEEDTMRYSSPPKKIEEAHEARESRIYEVLDKVRGPPLPSRNGGMQSSPERTKNRPPIPLPPEEVYEAVPDVEISPEPTPLPVRKGANPKTQNKIIKKKPIPEPKAPRQETQETPSVPKKPLLGKGTPMPGIAGPNGGVSNELQKVLQQRKNTMSQKSGEPIPQKHVPYTTPKPIRQTPVPPQPWSEQSTLEVARAFKEPVTKPEHRVQETPIMPKQKPWSPKPKRDLLPESPASQRSYLERNNALEKDNWQQSMERKGPNVIRTPMNPGLKERDQQSMERKGTKVTRIPMNPGLPPANAPPAKLVLPRAEALPDKPIITPKPKQLHPLPPLPLPEPNRLPPPLPPLPEPEVTGARAERADSIYDGYGDEFDHYDDLEAFRIYSI